MPCCIMKAVRVVAKCKFSSIMETDSVRNCVVGVAAKMEIQPGSHIMMTAIKS